MTSPDGPSVAADPRPGDEYGRSEFGEPAWSDPTAVVYYRDEPPFLDALSALPEAFGATVAAPPVADLAVYADVDYADIDYADVVDGNAPERIDRDGVFESPVPAPPSAVSPPAAPPPAAPTPPPSPPSDVSPWNPPRMYPGPLPTPTPTVPWRPPADGRRTPSARSRAARPQPGGRSPIGALPTGRRPPAGARPGKRSALGCLPALFVVGIVLFLSNGGVGLIKDLFDRNNDVPAGVGTAVTAYYSAAASGSISTAEQWVCSTDQSIWRRGQTAATGDTKRVVNFNRIVEQSTASGGWTVVARVTVRSATSSTMVEDDTVRVIKESGGYRVCGGGVR
jgi:hypothetical protein